MEFARKQLEKYGWKDGEGLGKVGNEGIAVPVKAKYKSGKEGMGFNLAKEILDPWWTNAYNESLSRVSVQMQDTVDKNKKRRSEVVVSFSTENEFDDGPPSAKIKKRLMKSNFPEFAKGATLTNGKMEEETTNSDVKDADKDKDYAKPSLTDEELLEACGGRTCHKAARFNYRLSGKLARLAAQDELELKKLNARKSQGRLT